MLHSSFQRPQKPASVCTGSHDYRASARNTLPELVAMSIEMAHRMLMMMQHP
jgi:hypothetical protein